MDSDKNKTQYKFQTVKNVLVIYKTGHKTPVQSQNSAKNGRGSKNANVCGNVHKISFALEDDNNFITYLVKRIAENVEKENGMELTDYIAQFSNAFDIATVDS